jgi:GNAT superfamily N-acetyltransferase
LAKVEQWLSASALQQQEKHLSVTKALIGPHGEIAGYYTLASGQVDFGELPAEITKRLPKRMLPVAIVAWLGVSTEHQGEGLGRVLLAQALSDCFEAGQTLAFIAAIVDCADATAKSFFQHWGFDELPGRPMRLFLSAGRLSAMVRGT